jgi:Tol biopolymer transport system component
VLKQADGASKVLFSPDGRYLAYDARISRRPASDRDVFILAVDGGRETRVAASPGRDVMMSWSPDGKTLLFASDRTGSMALWGVPVADGKAGGTAVLLRTGIQAGSLGVTAAGVLFSAASISSMDIHVASLDFSTGKVLSPPVRPIETFIGSNGQPDWSPDGKQMAYVSTQGRPADQRVLAIRSVDSGDTRELRPNLRGFTSPRWSPDGLSFLCQGTDLQGRQGIYRIDAQTGETVPIATSVEMGSFQWPQWSPDGRRIYYAVRGQLVERDVASGAVRELLPKQNIAGPVISPDGRYIAAYAGFKASAPSEPSSTAILVIPVAGGEPRELVRVRAPEQLRPVLAWTPGARGVMAEKFSDNGNRRELWLFPVEVGEPRKMDLAIDRNTSPLRVHPDGRQLAYVAGETRYEVVALENYLPGTGTVK